jgi:hypothetical protein
MTSTHAHTTPAQIDGELARIYAAVNAHETQIASAAKTVERIAAAAGSYAADYAWNSPEAAAAARELITASTEAVEQLLADAAPLEARYDAEQWTRYFLVDNSNGHVHTSTRCETCFPTTVFSWLHEQSGMSNAELVELAGGASCAVCFPNLPAEIMRRKTRLVTPETKAAREERATAKAARDAKRAAAAILPDGSELRITVRGYGERFATETAARNWLVGYLADHELYGDTVEAEPVQTVLDALAAKHGVTADEERTAIAAKVAAKIKRDRRNN